MTRCSVVLASLLISSSAFGPVPTLPPGVSVPGLPQAIALDDAEPVAGTDPEFLEKIRDRATTFSMTEGGTKTLDLKIATAP